MSGQDFADEFGLEAEMAQAGLRALTAAIEAGMTRPESRWQAEDYMQASTEFKVAGVRAHFTVAAQAIHQAAGELMAYKDHWEFDPGREGWALESARLLVQATGALVEAITPADEEGAA